MQATATTQRQRAKERPNAAGAGRHAPAALADAGVRAKRVSPQSVPVSTSEATPSGNGRHQNEGHGRRLTQAFEALEGFPALAESRKRLLAVMSKDHVATADVVRRWSPMWRW